MRVIFGEEKVKWMNDDDDINDGGGDNDGNGAGGGDDDDDDDVGVGWSLMEEYSGFLILIVSGDNWILITSYYSYSYSYYY